MSWFAGVRWRRLSRALVYAVVVAVPLGLLAFLVRTKFEPLVRLDQDVIVAATDYTRAQRVSARSSTRGRRSASRS